LFTNPAGCRPAKLCTLVCLIAALFLLRSTPLASGADTNATGTNIVIGLLLPPEEALAAGVRDGAQLAVSQANQTPGKKVTLMVRGRVGQWGADAQEAARMVLDDGATALIAPPDGAASHLALQVSGRTAVPVVSLCPDSSVSRAGVPWFARVVPRTIEEARSVFSNFNASPAPVIRWVAFVPAGRAGREISKDLREAAVMTKCSVEQIFEITPTNRDSSIAQVIGTNAGGVLVWLDPKPAAECVKSLKRAGFAGVVAGPIRLHSPEFVAGAGDALERFVLPGLFLGEGSQERFQAFQVVFRNQFKREPDIMAAFGFDAAALLIQILRNTETEALPRSFPLDFTVPGVSGILSFDKDGNRKLALQLLIFENGSFVPL
jgi:ABC-type branched-subunit amino acid transport system substrate-binding protein